MTQSVPGVSRERAAKFNGVVAVECLSRFNLHPDPALADFYFSAGVLINGVSPHKGQSGGRKFALVASACFAPVSPANERASLDISFGRSL